MTALQKTYQAVGVVSRYLCLAGGVVLLLMMGVMTCLDIVLRYFGAGIPGVWEAVTLAMRWMIGLALPYSFFVGSHIAVELFTDFFPSRWRRGFIILSAFITLVVISLMAWKITGRTLDTKGYGGVTSDLGLPTYYNWVPLAIGPLLSVPVLAIVLIRESFPDRFAKQHTQELSK